VRIVEVRPFSSKGTRERIQMTLRFSSDIR
jgi:hypothetical protein